MYYYLLRAWNIIMKKIFLLIVGIILIIGLYGCGTSVKKSKEYVPVATEKFFYEVSDKVALPDNAIAIFRARLDKQLLAAGKFAPSGTKNASQVNIIVTEYQMRHGAARALLGVFAGKDNMVSTVEIRDSNTNEIKNSFTVESFNITAVGSSRGLIEDQADQIITILTGTPVK